MLGSGRRRGRQATLVGWNLSDSSELFLVGIEWGEMGGTGCSGIGFG